MLAVLFLGQWRRFSYFLCLANILFEGYIYNMISISSYVYIYMCVCYFTGLFKVLSKHICSLFLFVCVSLGCFYICDISQP